MSCVLNSAHEPLEINKNLAKSASHPLSFPSAILDGIDIAERII